MDDAPGLQCTCRTCSTQKADDAFTPLFEGSSSCQALHKNAFAELIAFNLKIGRNDGLPQQICSRCIDNFAFIVQFRTQCKDAQEVLEAIYDRTDQSGDEIKILTECDVKAEPSVVKLEEVNVDAHSCNDDTNWDYEYLIDMKPNASADEGPDPEGLRMGDDGAIVSDSASSDDIPLRDYMRKGVTKKSKNIKRKARQKVKTPVEDLLKRRNDNPIYPCTHCGKKCRSASILSRHKKGCHARLDSYCEICTAEFESKEQFKTHLQEAHPDGGQPLCPMCSQTFDDANKRDLHIRTAHNSHNSDDEYRCEICDKVFKTKVYLKSHIARYHQSGEHECSICHEKFTNVNKYRYHWTHAHVENMKYKCSYCEKPFATQFVMRVHERSHTGERPFLCSECGIALRYRTQFLDHMKTHDNQRNIACDICGLMFYTNRQLSNHKRKHMSKNHPCEVCGAAFAYKLDLYAHRYNEHQIAEFIPKRKIDYPFKCPKCTKGFSVLTSLSKHIKIHTDTERKHVCPHCGNGYKRSDHLKLHIKRMHLKITEHKCEVCGREYLEKCALRAHMVVHNSARPFTCTKCPASFKRQRSLRDHMLKHEGKKEYACGICDMRFFNRTVVVLHTKRVHSDSQKQFMTELVRKELEEATSKSPEPNETKQELKEELINV